MLTSRISEREPEKSHHPTVESREQSDSVTVSVLLLTILTVLAAILRVAATHNDLWLDEIISVQIANALRTPWEMFTAVHSGNNHHTNTLYLYFVKNQSYAPVLRYLSVVWGVALVPAGYWLLARRSRVEALILSGLLACSYPLIHFSSEARGYSGAVLGSVVACGALTRWMAQKDEKGRSFLLGLTYGMTLTLALLSHLTACLIWFPLAVGSLITLVGGLERVKGTALWVALNFLPASVLAALYLLDPRFLTQLGGPPMTVFHGLGRLLTIGLGWPAKDAATVWILVLPLIGLSLWRLAMERKSDEPLPILLSLIFLTVLVGAFVLRSPFFVPRYFLVVLPFVYVAVATLLARLVGTRTGRIALGAVLALFLAGQAHLYVKFLQLGRGQFTAALQYMMTRTPSRQLTVASNQDFRSEIELAYYAPRVLSNRQLVYVTQESHASSKLDWFVLHEEGYEVPGPAAFREPGQPTWFRVAYFGASELSGQAWTIYSHPPGT